MNCIDARNGIDAIFILYEFNCLIAEENRVPPVSNGRKFMFSNWERRLAVWED